MTDDDIALAGALADAAGEAIRPHFRTRLAPDAKADASPVTVADRAAEAAMRRMLARHRPGDGIVGEEYGAERVDASRLWVLDPIDGTRSFLAGRPIFGTLVALLEEGRPVLGVIDQPIAGERWLGAAGRPTSFNGRPARTRPCDAVARAHVATTGPTYFAPGERARYEALAAGAANASWGGDCYNYGLLAGGHIDLVVESGLKLHDFAALVPVVEGAGGRMVDWRGDPLGQASDGRVIAVGDPRLLPEVLFALQ